MSGPSGSSRKGSSTDATTHIQGRSKQREKRRRRRSSESTDDEEVVDHPQDGRLDTTERDEDVDILGRIRRLGNDLEEHVQALQDYVELMADEGGYGEEAGITRETWGMLIFALGDWK
jgi:hypothetical protein